MIKLFVILLLIALTALFVVIEASLRTLHPWTIQVWQREGRRGASALAALSERIDPALSACQLAITANSLMLGWLGQPAVRSLLAPLFVRLPLSASVETFFSFLIAFVSITYLHVVLAGLVPQVLAAQRGEAVVLAVARPLLGFTVLLSPILWLLNRSTRRIVSLLGLQPAADWSDARSEEELRLLLSESLESGQINKNEYSFVNRIFAFDELLAKDIMVPRTDMVCLDAAKSYEENLRIIRREQYTRFPVIRQNKDDIIGVINTKSLFLAPGHQADVPLTSLVRPVMTVSENIPLPALLTKMQAERSHIAVLIDEYGGTSGMVTIEDILEEIVGDIRDEFDSEEEQEITEIAANHLIVDGKVSISLINDLLGADLEEADADTIGGWIYGQDLDIQEGTRLWHGDLRFTVLEREDSRIRKIEIEKRQPPSIGSALPIDDGNAPSEPEETRL